MLLFSATLKGIDNDLNKRLRQSVNSTLYMIL